MDCSTDLASWRLGAGVLMRDRDPRDNPRGWRHPITTPAHDWHIRLVHLWGRWRTPTRTAARYIACLTLVSYLYWIGSGVLQGSTRWRTALVGVPATENRIFLLMSPGFVSSMVMRGPECGIAERNVMLNRTNGSAGVWWFWVYMDGSKYTVMAGMARSTSNVTRTRWYNLRFCPTSTVMGVHFAFPLSICLIQNFPISNVVRTLLWPA